MSKLNSKTKVHQKLRTVSDLVEAGEGLYNKQLNGEIDNKTSDAANTTLKTQTVLLVKLPMDLMKLYVTSRIKKFELPKELLPPGVQLPGLTQDSTGN